MRSVSGVGRVAAFGAVIAASRWSRSCCSAAAAVLHASRATFINAGQLVKGNPVQIGRRRRSARCKSIKITDDGQAEITLKIKDEYAPLARAPARGSASSPSRASPTATSTSTTPTTARGRPRDRRGRSAPDHDHHGGRPRPAVQHARPRDAQSAPGASSRARRASSRGEGDAGQQGPSSTSTRAVDLQPAVQRAQPRHPVLERFLVDCSQLVTALAERRDDLAAWSATSTHTTRALGNQKEALAESIARLPAVHAPGQHHLREPARRARRRRPAGGRVEAGGREGSGRSSPRRARFAADAQPTVRDLRKHDPPAGAPTTT